MKNWFAKTDVLPLALFRICFGFLLACEAFGSLISGWAKYNIINIKVDITHIGFEFLSFIPKEWFYIHFLLMGLCGIGVMLGYKYRWSMMGFALLWLVVFLIQKASYNNHYYLMVLMSFIMIFLPANSMLSIDAKNNAQIKSQTMPNWCKLVMIYQMIIVYFFATLAKFYPDWLSGRFTGILFSSIDDYPFLHQNLFIKTWFHLFIAYSGLVFDGLVILAFLNKKTRTIALLASLLFHLFNSFTLKIGIFPYFALSFALFFYDPKQIRSLFLKDTLSINKNEHYPRSKFVSIIFSLYFIIQILLPLRHYIIKGDVLWTEEGHRLSWRMMLRERKGFTQFKVVEKTTGKLIIYDLNEKLNKKQIDLVSSKPDGIWQMAQYIKKEYANKGIAVKVFVEARVSINRRPEKLLVDPNVDMASAKWDYFFHNDWVLLYDKI